MYISTKTYGHNLGLSVCFRQHRAKSHCRFLHGYALEIRIEFEAEDLDADNWVIDFGGMKELKFKLESMFDHKMLVASDDPRLEEFLRLRDLGAAQVVIVVATGCEAFAKLIYETAGHWLQDVKQDARVRVRRVEVREHGANSAIYEG